MQRHDFRCVLLSTIATTGVALLGQPVNAAAQKQSAESKVSASGSPVQSLADETQIQDIIVTGQKRVEKANDVGITIGIASAERLQATNAVNVQDLTAIVPGFQVNTANTVFPIFSIRGVGFNVSQLSSSTAVSVYVDEAPLPYPSMTSSLLLDVERVEVLKGPQGTYFGQNATGGSIGIIAAKPTSELAVGGKVDVNHFGEVMLEGYVSGPLSSTLRARVAGTTTQFGTWQRGAVSPVRNGEQNKAAARLLLDWTPTDSVNLSLNLNGNYDHGEPQNQQLALIAPTNAARALPALLNQPIGNSSRDSNVTPGFDTHRRDHQQQAALRSDIELADYATLSTITSYIYSNTFVPTDSDGTALAILTHEYGGNIKAFYQEARIAGQFMNGRLKYIVGGGYQDDKIVERQTTIGIQFSGLGPGSVIDARYSTRNRAISGFGNMDFEIVPSLTITAGARYTSTRQQQAGCTFDGGNGVFTQTAIAVANGLRGRAGLGSVPAGTFVPGGCSTINDIGPNPQYLPIFADQSQKENNVSWRLGLNYKPTRDSLVYGLVSRGFKAGVYPVQNSLILSIDQGITQEQLTAYEVGTKFYFFDRHLHVNASAFYYDYKDKQFFTFFPVPGVGSLRTLVNIPSSTVKGFDLDVEASPFRGLRLNAALTYIKTKIGPFNGFNALREPVSFTGKEFNFAPPISATADAEYRTAVGSALDAFFGVGVVYSARTFADLGESPSTRIPSYFLVNPRIGLQSGKGWRLSLWARNLTNKFYWSSVSSAGDTLTRLTGRPQTFGATFSVKYP